MENGVKKEMENGVKKEDKKEKRKARPKVPIRVIFRVIGLKALSLGPICLAIGVGCLIGLISYYTLSALYYFSPSILGFSHFLFAILLGPLILLFIFLFALIFCFFCCLRIRRLPKREVVLESQDDFEKDFMAKESMMYSFTIKLIYLGYFWLVAKLFPPPFGLLVSFNRFLGAKIGKMVRTIEPGTILDPDMVEIEDNTIIGGDAIISGHIADTSRLAIKKVKIGKNCLIGARSFIWPGVVMGDNVTVGSGAIVLEDAHLPANSVWVGVPARMIKQKGGKNEGK
jgi:hypothetical protein